jgi:hypothetical protein
VVLAHQPRESATQMLVPPYRITGAVTPLSRPAKGMTKLANMGRCFRCSRDRDLDLDVLDLERVPRLGHGSIPALPFGS